MCVLLRFFTLLLHPLKTMKPEGFAAFKRLPPGSIVKVRYRCGEASPVEARLVLAK